MQPQETQPAQPPQQPAYDPAMMAEMERRTTAMNLARAMKNGASNFYWIAALSVVNSVISIFGGGMVFVFGLGSTLIIDAIAKGTSDQLGGNAIVLGVGFLFSLMFDLIFAAFGYFAGKGKRWAFIIGMILYGIDALLMLVFQDWIGFAFHLYFMWGIWQGMSALGKLQAFEAANPMAVPPAETMR